GAPAVWGGTFTFGDVALRYLPEMPVLTNASGYGVIAGPRLTLSLETGEITAPTGETIDGSGSSFALPNLADRPLRPTLTLRAKGPLRGVLSTLDQKPFEFLKKARRPADLGSGAATVAGTFTFPIKRRSRPEEIDYDAAAIISEFSSGQLLPGQQITAQQVDVTVANGNLTISVPGQIGDATFDGRWEQRLGPPEPDAAAMPAKFSAEVAISEALLSTFNISLPPGTLGGLARGRFEFTPQPDGAPRFTLSSRLEGATLSIPPLSWEKPAEEAVDFFISGTLGAEPRLDTLRLDGKGLRLRGDLSTIGGQLDTLQLSELVAGDWFDGSATLRGRPGQTPLITINGGTLDLRNLPEFQEADASNSDAAPMEVRLNRVVVGEDIALTNLVGQISTRGGVSGRFAAQLNGTGRLEGVLLPSAAGTQVQIQSQDGGGLLAAAGIGGRAAGEALTLNLRPTGAPGTYVGSLRLTNFRLLEAPAFASLLSAASIVGLLEQLNGQGIVFSDVEAEFEISPERFAIARSSAIGPSMGLSLDGTLDRRSKAVALQGVLSPLYIVNWIGTLFSRNREGLFGMNFTIGGRTGNLEVGVNPLSLLTPGMFREIFRRPPPEIGG
ncbi:MAG: DUF3971 domain-containing protein, partial [Pseudomonadota bacterium]